MTIKTKVVHVDLDLTWTADGWKDNLASPVRIEVLNSAGYFSGNMKITAASNESPRSVSEFVPSRRCPGDM